MYNKPGKCFETLQCRRDSHLYAVVYTVLPAITCRSEVRFLFREYGLAQLVEQQTNRGFESRPARNR